MIIHNMIKDKKKRAENAKIWYHKNKDKVSKRRKIHRTLYKNTFPEYQLYYSAKARAKKKGLPFNIEKKDIVIPDVCPLLGIKLSINTKTVGRNSPTLDRIIPSLGYIKENIMVISNKANSIKQDATIQELELLITNLKRYTPVV